MILSLILAQAVPGFPVGIPVPGACQQYLTDVAKAQANELDKQARAQMTGWTNEQEAALGQQIYQELVNGDLAGKVDTDAAWVAYLKDVSAEITPKIPNARFQYQIHFVNDDQLNAFAIPGGHVFVHRGILEKIVENESQLAIVIGHEIGHIELNHCAALYQYASQIPIFANDLGAMSLQFARHAFSSEQELDSDRYGLTLVHLAGYDSKQGEALWMKWATLSGDAPATPVLPVIGIPLPAPPAIPGLPVDPGAELANLMITHPSEKARACVMRETQVMLAQQFPQRTAYLGVENFQKKTARSKKAYK